MSDQPNLFLLGAPKCGTTSLARWLEGHPDVFVPSVKEPHHYNRDERQVYYHNRADYLELFKGSSLARYRLDASVWYLHSQVAVPEILKDCPDALFLVCLRNPVDMAFSLYHQYLNKSGREHIRPFEKAWLLSKERLKGDFVSSLASEPAYLAYQYSCRIGSQSKRLLELVPKGRVQFVVLDDLIESPQQTLSSILEFLGLPENGPLRIPHENVAHGRRSHVLHRGLVRLAKIKKRLRIRKAPKQIGELVKRLDGFNTRVERPQMSAETRQMVTEYFLEEIYGIWEVVGGRYDQWIECISDKPQAEEFDSAEAS